MMTIFKRELRSYFLSPMAYVFMAGFFIIAGIFFMMINIIPPYGANSVFTYTLSNMKLVLLFIIPALSMKLIAEETKNKTDQLLLTSPISIYSIVIGKFLAASMVFLVTIAISFIYPIILTILGKPSVIEYINTYLGFFLLGLTFIAICIFMSSITDNQVIAFILGFTTILSLWVIGFIEETVSNKILSGIIKWISLLKRYEDFAGGIFKLGPIVYYLSVIVIFIFLTIKSIEKRRII